MSLKKNILTSWYIYIALILVAFQVNDLLARYPQATLNKNNVNKVLKKEALLQKVIALRTNPVSWGEGDSLVVKGSPFGKWKPKKKKKLRKRAIKLPSRRFKMKGSAGSATAILLNHQGQSVFVNVGDRIDSALVIKVTPTLVVLKDRGGTFEVEMEP